MLGLPKSTEYGKRIPKNKFYKNMNLSAKLDRLFIEQIDSIIWQNKLSPDTINLSATENVQEIEVIEIRLKTNDINKKVLELIDRNIPYHIVYVLSYKDREKLCISYKEKSQSQDNKFKVDTFYFSDWAEKGSLILEISALNIAALYESWIRELVPLKAEQSLDIKSMVEKDKERQRLLKQLEILENKLEIL